MSVATIGHSSVEVCRAAGVTYRQLDYWARTGLVAPTVAEAGGQGVPRRWSDADLSKVRLVARMLVAGLSLRRVREVLEILVEHRTEATSPPRWLVVGGTGTGAGSALVGDDLAALVGQLDGAGARGRPLLGCTTHGGGGGLTNRRSSAAGSTRGAVARSGDRALSLRPPRAHRLSDAVLERYHVTHGVACHRSDWRPPPTLARVVSSSGRSLAKLYCPQCRCVGPGLPYSVVPEDQVALIPLLRTHVDELVPCERCGSTEGVERHHWYPRALDGAEESERWPTSFLCPTHHRAWHARMRAMPAPVAEPAT